MDKMPDWVQASVAVLLFIGACVGIYSSLNSQVAVQGAQNDTKFKQYDERFNELERYDTYLQSQIDSNKHDNTVLTTKMEYAEQAQKELATGFKELAAELRKTNNYLIEIKTEQNARKEKKNG